MKLDDFEFQPVSFRLNREDSQRIFSEKSIVSLFENLNQCLQQDELVTQISQDVLGSSQYGGNVICAASSIYWVVAPSSTEVSRDWYQRNHAVTTANSNASCGDWFVPNLSQLLNPGWECRTYWDSASGYYWSTCQHPAPWTKRVNMDGSAGSCCNSNYYTAIENVRAFRCVSY